MTVTNGLRRGTSTPPGIGSSIPSPSNRCPPSSGLGDGPHDLGLVWSTQFAFPASPGMPYRLGHGVVGRTVRPSTGWSELASLRLVLRLATRVCGLYERAILSETLLLPEIALFILLVYRFRENPTLRVAAVLGGMSGLMAVTRSEQVLTFPLVVLPAILGVNRRNWRRAVAWLVVAAAVLVLLIIPWTIFTSVASIARCCFRTDSAPPSPPETVDPPTTDPTLATGKFLVIPITRVTNPLLTPSMSTTGSVRGEPCESSAASRLCTRRSSLGFWNPFQQTTIDAQW